MYSWQLKKNRHVKWVGYKSEACVESCQISIMELNTWKPLNIFAKSPIINVW